MILSSFYVLCLPTSNWGAATSLFRMGAYIVGDLNVRIKLPCIFYALGQQSANCGPWVRSRAWGLFSQITLVGTQPHSLLMDNQGLLSHCTAEWARRHRDHVAHKPQVFIIWPFTESLATQLLGKHVYLGSWLIIFRLKTKPCTVAEARA